MKKCLLFVFIIHSLFIFSCANEKLDEEENSQLETIKGLFFALEENTQWTEELEKERLSKKLSDSAFYIKEGSSLTPENAKLSPLLNQPVFPYFKDFGSLDISSVQIKYLEAADKFSSFIAEENRESAFFSFPENYRFNYVFFESELKKGWKENFLEDFPLKEEKSLSEEKTQPDKAAAEGTLTSSKDSSSENPPSDEEAQKESSSFRIFERWILAEPFVSEKLVQIPVRFYCRQGFVDVTLYMNAQSEKSFYDIKIERWGKND